jgi:hypothetical protein
MYENLKTSSANDFKEMYETVKKETLEIVKNNLKLT